MNRKLAAVRARVLDLPSRKRYQHCSQSSTADFVAPNGRLTAIQSQVRNLQYPVRLRTRYGYCARRQCEKGWRQSAGDYDVRCGRGESGLWQKKEVAPVQSKSAAETSPIERRHHEKNNCHSCRYADCAAGIRPDEFNTKDRPTRADPLRR